VGEYRRTGWLTIDVASRDLLAVALGCVALVLIAMLLTR
jgi:hypothetical protein